jgi:dolichol-phosphate mannosyltransferase
LNRMGNWLFTFLVRTLYKVNITDLLTGYVAWDYVKIKQLAPNLKSPGFAIETEMVTKMARLGFEIYAVPITYNNRIGESSLHPIKDGYRILRAIFSNLT